MNEVIIEGKTYPCKFTVQALLDFQEKFNKDFQDIDKNGNGLGYPEMISIVYSCLKSGAVISDTKLDITEEKLPHLLGMGELADLITKIMKKDLPKTKDDPKKK